MRCLLPVVLALAASSTLLAQAATSQRVSASPAGATLRVNRLVSVEARNLDPQHPESRDHLERMRTAALGALKGTPLQVVSGKDPAQATLFITVSQAGEHHADDFASVILRENASGNVVYCSSEQGMAQHSAVRDLLTQFNAVVLGKLPAPTPDALDSCVAQARLNP